MTDDAILRELAIAFEYTYLHDDWVHPLEEALAGLSAKDAHRRHAPDSMGIWDIVLHTAVWNENIVERVRTGQNARPAEGSWPPPPENPDEAAWERDKQRLRDSLEAVRTMFAEGPLSAIENSPYGLADAMCRFIHVGYHIGQIVKIRDLAGI